MTTKTTITTPTFEIPSASLEAINAAMTQAAERSQSLMETSLKTWQTEVGHYFQELTEQGRATFEALGKCQSPTEVLAAEQQWLEARTKAYIDSGQRFAKAFSEVAQSFAGSGKTPPT